MKFYIAFSIRGSNAFVTATKETNDFKFTHENHFVTIDGLCFGVAKSRRASYKPEDGVKLHYQALFTKAGEPLRAAPMVLKHFKALEALGWTVDKTAFIAKHWR